MIKLSGVTKSFGAIDVLTGVDLELHRGDSMVLVGRSGSGSRLRFLHLSSSSFVCFMSRFSRPVPR